MKAPQHHGVAAAVVVDGQRVLLCHRHPDRAWFPDVWDLPGGHVEPGEVPADAVVRELREELGIGATLVESDPFAVRELGSNLTLSVWVVADWVGEIVNAAPDEHDELAWFRGDEVAALKLADPALVELCATALSLADR